MLTPEAMLTLAAELTDAAAEGDAESLAAIAWRLYGEAGENLAEITRLRAAIRAAWTRPQETAPPAPAAACSETAGTGAASGSTAMPQTRPPPRTGTAAVAAAVGWCHPIPDVPGGWPVPRCDVAVTGQGLTARLPLAGQPPTRHEPRPPATPDRALQRSAAGVPAQNAMSCEGMI
jgi:hypothetical protein